MDTYNNHRFPPAINSCAAWLYCGFSLSHRDIDELMAERGLPVSQEAVRMGPIRFGVMYRRRLKRRQRGWATLSALVQSS
jgi:putative transposase